MASDVSLFGKQFGFVYTNIIASLETIPSGFFVNDLRKAPSDVKRSDAGVRRVHNGSYNAHQLPF